MDENAYLRRGIKKDLPFSFGCNDHSIRRYSNKEGENDVKSDKISPYTSKYKERNAVKTKKSGNGFN